MLGILHKIADFQRCRPSAINAYLFLLAWLLTSAYTFSFRSSLFVPRVAIAVAVSCGLGASVAILAFQTGSGSSSIFRRLFPPVYPFSFIANTLVRDVGSRYSPLPCHYFSSGRTNRSDPPRSKTFNHYAVLRDNFHETESQCSIG